MLGDGVGAELGYVRDDDAQPPQRRQVERVGAGGLYRDEAATPDVGTDIDRQPRRDEQQVRPAALLADRGVAQHGIVVVQLAQGRQAGFLGLRHRREGYGMDAHHFCPKASIIPRRCSPGLLPSSAVFQDQRQSPNRHSEPRA